MSIPVEHPRFEGKMWDWPLQTNDEFVNVTDNNDRFEVGLDAKYFTPKEIEVKAIGELLEIHLEHDARSNDYGNVSRNITRCYKLPKDVNTKTLKSNLDHRGVLHISALKMH